QTLDILPGIYHPATYLDRLDQFRLLARFVDYRGQDQRAARLRGYHRGQAEALAKPAVPPRLVAAPNFSKSAIQANLKTLLVAGTQPRQEPPSGDGLPLESAEDLANWRALAEDTRVNETVHRRQIHERLATTGLVRPETITKWLYKEVLHADLDDPYLGLGNLLFAR